MSTTCLGQSPASIRVETIASSVKRECRVEKYRPSTLDDVVSHRDIISTSEFLPLRPLLQAILLNHVTVDKFIKVGRLPHLLLYGPPGTGKTTTILAVARKLFAGGREGALRNNVLEVRARVQSKYWSWNSL
jgi:replication factor C subunit 3/5